MATIHRTTLEPTKLELLTGWLPEQSWYEGGGQSPALVRAGGFRLDDPEGEVGIEFMIVVDTGGQRPVAYLTPLSYRGSEAKDIPAEALIGTSEHGVLGTRWIYDGDRDPVVRSQLEALLRGEAEPQKQSESNTPDPTVTVHGADPGEVTGEARITRVLRQEDAVDSPARRVVTGWTWPDATAVWGVVATFAGA
ncbi:maltokinase N-terminal cap-like domain-containing protein [Streptomyces sp. bgisy091]|uniref:maltokinase N-terminal cap-like domain-containing protein n=1 Tax=Streptomyces sp. bgisy091 TaxID=3413778 RepID=UPI003D71CE61